jgi:Methyltransferase domain
LPRGPVDGLPLVSTTKFIERRLYCVATGKELMAHEGTTDKNATSSFSRRVSTSFFLVAVLVAILDGVLIAPYLVGNDPARDWPAITVVPDQAPHPYRKDYRFTSDWFTDHVPVWATALKEYQGKPNVSYLEIGTWEGRSLLWALDNVLTDPTSHLTAIDPLIDDPGWPASKDIKGTLFSNIKLSGEEARVNVIVGYSQIELRKLSLESYDIIYVDGSHTASDTLEDLVLSSRLLKPGGLLIMDDYENYLSRRTFDQPKFAMDAFHACFHDQFEVVHNGFQVILRKKKTHAA